MGATTRSSDVDILVETGTPPCQRTGPKPSRSIMGRDGGERKVRVTLERQGFRARVTRA
jgi:hypothetical protein